MRPAPVPPQASHYHHHHHHYRRCRHSLPPSGLTSLPRLDSLEALLRPYAIARPALAAACRNLDVGGVAASLQAQVGRGLR